MQALAVTSAQSQDGKSTIAANLATILAEGGKRAVLCAEADLYHPTIGESLGLKTDTGLVEVVENRQDPLAAVVRLEPLGWYLLPAGRRRDNPAERLNSDYFAAVVTRLRDYFEWIVFDLPPALAVTDAIMIANHLDGTLVVVRAGETPKEAIEEAMNLLGEKNLVGIVLNDAQSANLAYSKYYGRYYSRKP